ncbi:hypothetical protein D3C75_1279410 [compost metagenome]
MAAEEQLNARLCRYRPQTIPGPVLHYKFERVIPRHIQRQMFAFGQLDMLPGPEVVQLLNL